MRFPYDAHFRIIPVSPISDQDEADDNEAFGKIYVTGCFASATSGTFDPDIQFDGQALLAGAFGQLVDVWISNRNHRRLTQAITDTGITFSAPLQLRLTNILLTLANNRTRQTVLFDPLSVDPPSGERLPRGYPLNATRVFPTMTALTFDLKRVGI